MSKVNVAGIELENLSMRESAAQAVWGMENSALYIVEEITMETLLEAKEDEKLRDALEQTVHTVIADTELLEAAGEKDSSRRDEIKQHEFFRELIGRLVHDGRSFFLIGEEEKEVARVYEYFVEEFPDCLIGDATALGSYEGTMDSIVNEINALDTDVVVSLLPSPKQEHFLLENKDMLSVRLWYGMDFGNLTGQSRNLGGLLRKRLHRIRLKEDSEGK